MIKSLKRNDIRYTPFVANKSWNAQNQRFEDLISWQSGSESGSLLLTFLDYGDGTKMSEISSAFSSALAYQQQDPDFIKFKIGKEITGSTFYTINSVYYNSDTNPVNIDDSYQRLVYNTVKNLYYKESENPTQIFGLESLDASEVNRSLPNQISIFDIPVNKFGEKIVPNSVEINHDLPIGYTTVIDDGNNNLKVSGSIFSDIKNVEYNCVSAKINHTNLNQTYDGSPKSVSKTTVPSNLTVSTKYNGISTSPTNAGTYTVLSEISDGFYCGTQQDSFIINKKSATVTVTDVSNIYDGKRHDVTVTTVPANLNYNIVYTLKNQSNPVDPIGVETYYATVTINDINHTGVGTGKSTITAPESIINLSSIQNVIYTDVWKLVPQAYDSVNGFQIEFSVSPSNLASIIYDNGVPKISLENSKGSNSLGTVTLTAKTKPNKPGYIEKTTSISFTINPKPIRIKSGISVVDRSYASGNTSVTIKNSNILFDAVIVDDIKDVTIASAPTTGTISSDNIGLYPVNFSNYVLGGSKSSKYSLVQPTLRAQILSNEIALNDTTFQYDGSYWSAIDILNPNLTGKQFPQGNLKLEYYLNENLIATENYLGGKLIPGSPIGNLPIDAGVYKVKVTNNKTTFIETVEKKITVTVAIPSINLDNTFQGGIKTIKFEDKYKTIKPLENEIQEVKPTSISIKNRKGGTVYFNNLLGDVNIKYNGSETKPSTKGEYTLTVNLDTKNLKKSISTDKLRIGDFIYLVTKNVNETYNDSSFNLENDYISPSYNLKKYFDPSIDPNWSTTIATYKNLSGIKLNAEKPYLQVIMTGGGGGAYSYNKYDTTDNNITTTYYDCSNNVLKTEKSRAIKIYNDFNLTTLKSSCTVIQEGYFYVPVDQLEVKFTLYSSDATLDIDGLNVLDAVTEEVQRVIKQGNRPTKSIVVGNANVTLTLSRGYHKISLRYTKSQFNGALQLTWYYPNQGNTPTQTISFVTLQSFNYGGGSAASLGLTLPARYILENNLGAVKFVVGKSGQGSASQTIQQTEVFTGKVALSVKMTVDLTPSIYDNIDGTLNPTVPGILQKPGLAGDSYYGGVPRKIPATIVIFKIDNYPPVPYAILHPNGNNLDQERFLTVWNGGIRRTNELLYIEKLDSSLSSGGKFVITQYPADSNNYTCKLEILTTNPGEQKYNFRLYYKDIQLSGGGSSYMITGSVANPTGSYLGLIAGGGFNGSPEINYGTSSVYRKPYTGVLYDTNKPLYSVFSPYVGVGGGFTNPTVFDSQFNKTVNGNNGDTNGSFGQSVDLQNQSFGKGGSNDTVYGYRGNYVLLGSNLLYEIYANSSSIYDVTQIT